MTDISKLLQADPATMKLGDVVDGYKALNTMRLAMQKETESVASVERAFREHLISSISKSDEKGVYGLKYRATIKSKTLPKVKDGDWSPIYQYVRETDDFSVFQKRLSDKHIMDMVEAGHTPPGIELMHIPDVSVVKL